MPDQNQIVGLTLAAALGIAGLSYSNFIAGPMAQRSGNDTCTSFQFTSTYDPHIATYAGGASQVAIVKDDIPNFVTVANSVGGATVVSTKTRPFSYGDVNNQITITHSDWTLTADLSTPKPGASVVAVLTDSAGIHKLTTGSLIQEPNGTVVAFNGADLSIGQRLSFGGSTLMTIKAYSDYGASGLNLNVVGKGTALVNGFAASQVSATDAALVYACDPALTNRNDDDALFMRQDAGFQADADKANGVSAPAPSTAGYIIATGQAGASL